jgi:Fe-S oxidoreductase
MGLTDCLNDMEMCSKCSACKFIPIEKVSGEQHAQSCPSVARYNFHSYSGGGRLATGVALLSEKIQYSPGLMDIIYNCQMCGACDISCKYGMDMEVLEPLTQLRIKCVEDKQTKPALNKYVGMLKNEDSMVSGYQAKRGDWARNLKVKDATREKVEVIFHAGCRTTLDKRLWKSAQAAVELLQKAGVDVGIMADNESCCGGRALSMGYQEAFLKQSRKNAEKFKESGATTLVTGCAECYQAFKVKYEQHNLPTGLEIIHITEYLDRLIKKGKLQPKKALNMTVTYQDPCHLGRLGEPYVHWKGKKVAGHMYLFDPPKPYRRGTFGVYEPPRELLKSIPGVKLVEMDRNREAAWCCGAGGGVKENNPEFASWTAAERIQEAICTGAEALITACPGCERNFNDSLKSGESLKVLDIVELLNKSI